MADVYQESLKLHEEHHGKISVESKVTVENMKDLSLAYTPGVAQPCREIHADEEAVYRYTSKSNLVAVVSDGSAVLGLGNIGPKAAMPVMEGKAILFKEFADIDAFPICLDTQDSEEIIRTVKYLAPTFGGINLEDISAPRCFEIERRLRQELDIPVFHDDQHGTAIVVSAGILNALRLVNKELGSARFVINGAGSAGISIATLLMEIGARDIIMVDRSGILCEGETWMNPAQAAMAEKTNREHLRGTADPATSLELARPLRTPQAGNDESDAAFLLLEDAAQKGNAEAMFLVGQFYDPQSKLPRGSIPADMSQAKHWYDNARSKGYAEADKALAALRRHVEGEAAKGNAEASLLLREWK